MKLGMKLGSLLVGALLAATPVTRAAYAQDAHATHD